MIQLSFNINNLNSSLQVGDMVYASPTSQQNLAVDFESEVGEPNQIGVLLRITNPSAGVFLLDIDDSGKYVPQINHFIMFSKHSQTNGDINGYYAKANFTNDSREKAELFAVSSEIIINSK